jgi:hypothetical protein
MEVFVNIIEELEKRIADLTSHIDLSKQQLEDSESNKIKLSLIATASAELSVEKNGFLLNIYTQKLKKLKSQDMKEILEKEKEKKETIKNNYFKYQVQRLKRDKTKTNDAINDALFVMNDLPEEVQLDDMEIFEIGHKCRKLYLEIHSDLDDDLLEIKNEFIELVDEHFDESNQELKLLNYRIPIIILQLRVLLQNIQENIKDEKLKDFKGFPKFEDWWIHELWVSHQAYMGLFKWKRIILNLFVSHEQKKAFGIVFKNWILVKKILNVKGESGYIYNKAFDMMIFKYAELEDEQDKSNLDSLEKIVEKITKEENFITVSKKHNIMTPYLKFKLDKEKEKEEKKESKG